MLDTLKFVRAAVSKNDLQPTLAHFLLRPGSILANNGALAIQAPFDVDLTCAPHAGQFFKAIAACEGVIALTLEAGRLIVRSGRFKSAVDCCDAARFPIVEPGGTCYRVQAPIIPVLEKLAPFMSTDELRPWACGVYLANNSAFATNNISIIEHWLPVAFPVLANLPAEAVKELCRLKVEPESVQAEPHQVTFNLPGGAWVCCKVLTYKFPDLQRVFEAAQDYRGPFLSGDALAGIITDAEKLAGFTDELKTIYFLPGAISTSKASAPGTSLDNPSTPANGAWRVPQLLALRGIADRVGFDSYPAPVPFFGQNLRGVLAGVRVSE
jgi:DNA polymerase III sliding clamp (beta) subunit (PCNA family)